MLLALLIGLVGAGVALGFGEVHWKAGTRKLRDRLEAGRLPLAGMHFDARELKNLPAPVRRYLRRALTDGQPIITAVDLTQTGTFNLNEANPRWKSFVATQRIITRRPSFAWDARIAVLPGVSVRVRDAYVAGQGSLQVAMLGLVPVAKLGGTRELAEGELMRFLAEAVWYPTALLPSQGVRWEAADDVSSRATLRDGAIEITLLFRFNKDAMVSSVRAAARTRTTGATVTSMPWECKLWNYALRDGLQVPLEGEAAWVFPEEIKPYWRGRITTRTYELAVSA